MHRIEAARQKELIRKVLAYSGVNLMSVDRNLTITSLEGARMGGAEYNRFICVGRNLFEACLIQKSGGFPGKPPSSCTNPWSKDV